MSKIEVSHFTKDYGHGRGVFDANFAIEKGEVYGFLGPNGAGKSTTIRHLMGFSKPDGGSVKILGQESFENYSNFMDKVGYLPGEIALPDGLSGYEFLDMMKKLKHVTDDKWVQHLIDYFELDPHGETKRMSLGVKRKLAVVTAFMNDPDILILDEPTSGLDLAMQQKFIEFVKQEKARGKTVLLSSHIFSEVDATCDRIAIIKDGKIVSEFVADDLRHNNNKNYRIEFAGASDLEKFVRDNKNNDFVVAHKEGNCLIVNIDDKNINKLISAVSKVKILSFKHLRETLEDYFMKYYKEDKDYGGALDE